MISTTAKDGILKIAQDYCRHGWAVVPIPYKTKSPLIKGWQNLRLTDADIPNHFNGQPQNIGVLLGEPSGWLVDVDVDHMEAVALAREYLPPTDARFGRESKPESHWLYRVIAPIETAKFQTANRAMLVELRATGCQTVFPGSTHPSGEVIRWDHEGEPATIDPAELLETVRSLAECAAEQIGETIKHPAPAMQHRRATQTTGDADRAWRYVTKMPDAIAGQGGHNATFTAACELFRFGLSDADARQLLTRFNAEKCSPLWTDSELGHKLADARERVASDGEFGSRLNDRPGKMKESHAAQVKDSDESFDHRADCAGDPIEAARAGRPWPATEYAMSRRFVHNAKGRWLFDARVGCGRYWDGKRWRPDENRVHATRIVAETSRRIFAECAALPAGRDDLSKELSQWAIRSQQRCVIDNTVELASRQIEMCPDSNSWDADAMLLNCGNGIFDARTFELKPHDPAALLTRLAPAHYDPRAADPLFSRVLTDWLPNEADRAFVQRAAGTGITGEILENLFLTHGPTSSGKSSFIESIAKTLGDYAATADFASFLKSTMGRHGGAASEDIARLAGTRFVKSSETERGRELADGLIKNMTGGESITARFLYRGSFEFTPGFKIWLICNAAPSIDAEDDAIWRRVIRVPFNHTIPVEKRDPRVKARLIDPADLGPTILNWLIEGYREYKRIGLAPPTSIIAARDELRNDMDVLGQFFDERLVFGVGHVTTAKDVAAAYDQWAHDQGYRFRASPKRIAAALGKRGCEQSRTRFGKQWIGVGVSACTL